MKTLNKNNLPAKVHLSGSDCFHLVLDKHAKKHNAGGNVMRIVFYFDERLSVENISEVLYDSPVIHWLCNITLVPGSLLRIPYWKYEDKGRQILITEHEHDTDDEIPEVILNRDILVDAKRFVECDIIHYASGKNVFVLSWNHILMDGRGIGMMVNHLNETDKTHGNQVDRFFPAKEKKPNIIDYILNMYKVKKFIRHSSKAPISSVAKIGVSSPKHFNNRIIHFSEEETAQISKVAFKNGARFGANLYYLSCCTHIVNQINQQNGKEGVLWIPIPYDGRLRGSFGPIISNFVAYLFYRIPQSALNTLPDTVKCFNTQMAEQLKEQMPQKYNKLLNMMRHFPLGLYYFLISRAGKGSFASFLYSSTGDNFNNLDTFFNLPVKDLTIFPSSTYPPGLTFSFLKHRNKLNINIAYSSEIISNIELDTLEKGIKRLLLDANNSG